MVEGVLLGVLVSFRHGRSASFTRFIIIREDGGLPDRVLTLSTSIALL